MFLVGVIAVILLWVSFRIDVARQIHITVDVQSPARRWRASRERRQPPVTVGSESAAWDPSLVVVEADGHGNIPMNEPCRLVAAEVDPVARRFRRAFVQVLTRK